MSFGDALFSVSGLAQNQIRMISGSVVLSANASKCAHHRRPRSFDRNHRNEPAFCTAAVSDDFILFLMMLIRPADHNDLPALMALRNWYIDHSYATFDEQHLSLRQMAQWFTQFNTGPHRCFVAVADGEIAGYCSSQAYRAHPAFRHTIETSIYVAASAARSGVGSALYQHLFDALRGQDLHRAVVGIALPNDASVALHENSAFAVSAYSTNMR
jgi:phosphinothricin acetyltransferase